MNIKGNKEMLKGINDYEGPKIYVRYTYQAPEMKKMGANTFGCCYLRSVPFVTKINTMGDGLTTGTDMGTTLLMQ